MCYIFICLDDCIFTDMFSNKLHRYPTFFDDVAARLLPVVPLIVYRLIENDATDPAERILVMYSQFLAFHPLRFTFVRDILAYFYGHLPGKLIVRILNVLDLKKVMIIFLFHLGPSQFKSANFLLTSMVVSDTIFRVFPTAH